MGFWPTWGLALLGSAPDGGDMNPNVLLGILPFRTGVADEDSLWSLLEIMRRGYPFLKVDCQRTDKQRNEMARLLLASPYSHILMLDADHKHPPDIVERLVQRVIDDPTRLVVSGLSFRRGPPYDPTAWVVGENGQVKHMIQNKIPHGLVEVDIVGGSALLIHRSVFERIEWPWFELTYVKGQYAGEDVTFCNKCRTAGIKIYSDTTVQSPHLAKRWIDEETFNKGG